MADKLQYIDIERIQIGDRFRKDMQDLDTLVKSIQEKGVLQPITVFPDMRLLAGGRRVEAAKLAGLTKIPALVRDFKHIDESDRDIDLREIELVENTFRADFTWQERTKLLAELDRLMREKHGKEWSTRKTAGLIGQSHPMNVVRALQLQDAIDVLPEIGQAKTADEALKMLKKAEEKLLVNELSKRQKEDIKTGKKHYGLSRMLQIADANYEIGDALQGMADCEHPFASFIEVDPPYGIDLDEQKRQSDGTNLVKTYNEVDRATYQAFVEEVATQTFRLANTNCWMIFWYGPSHHGTVFNALIRAGWLVDEIPAIWSKGSGQTNAPEVHLARTYEPFFICRKGRPALHKRGRANVFEFTPVAGQKKYHPTERPIELMLEVFDTFMFEGSNSTVLVPFAGSGVSLRAAYLRGFKALGWDLNAEYKPKFLLAVEQDMKKLFDQEDKADED